MSKAPQFKAPWLEGDICFIQCLGAELKNLEGDSYYEKRKEKAIAEGKSIPQPWSINFQFLIIKDGYSSTIKFFNASVYVPEKSKDFDSKSNLGKVAKAFNFDQELTEALPHYFIDSPAELEILNKLCTDKWAKVIISIKEDAENHKYPRINTLVPCRDVDRVAWKEQFDLYKKNQDEKVKHADDEMMRSMTEIDIEMASKSKNDLIARGDAAAKELHG